LDLDLNEREIMDQSTLTQNTFDGSQQQDAQPTTEIKNESDERGTPPDWIEGLIDTNNGLFEIDLASGAETKPIGDVKLDKETNALTCSWDPSDHPEKRSETHKPVTPGSGYLNTPFSKELVEKFARKVDLELSKGSLDYIIYLCSAQAISNDWFTNNIMPHVNRICIPEKRMTFTDADGGSMGTPSFPSVLFTLGDAPDQFAEFFSRKGECFEIIEQDPVLEDIYEFIQNSVHKNENNPGLISTSYKRDEPILNNVGRGDILELEIGDSMVGYPDSDLLNETVQVEIKTWSEENGMYTITTNLLYQSSSLVDNAFVILKVNKQNPSSFMASHQVGSDLHWKPLPVTDIKTISSRFEWS